jgi:hypothetical protein
MSEINTEDVNTGDAVEVTDQTGDGTGLTAEELPAEREPLVRITTDTNAYVDITVQLATGESFTFSRSYVGGLDTSPLEVLDNLADAVKSYLETF